MPTNAINDTGVKYLYDKLHGEIEPIAEAVSDSEVSIEGNPLNFNTLSAQTAKSTILSVEPIQDLHGYDKPWVGGDGKNKLPMTVDSIKAANTDGTWSGNAYTHNGVTFIILTDTDNNVVGIKANNLASNDAILYIPITMNAPFIANGCQSGASDSTFYFVLNVGGWYIANRVYATDKTFDSGSVTKSALVVASGYTANNVIFYPMIRLSTETDATFAPYTNECSISGRTEIGILGCGKNLANQDGTNTDNGYVHNSFINANGEIQLAAGSWDILEYIRVKPSTTYKISGLTVTSVNGYVEYDINKSMVAHGVISSNPFTLVTSANTKYIRINRKYDTDLTVQVEESTQTTSYSPYTKSNDLTISLGDTVYGGTLDVENGVLVVDRGYLELDGSSDEQWKKAEPASEIYHRRFLTKNLPSLGVSSNKVFDAISNEFKNSKAQEYDTQNGVFILRYVNNTNRIDITCDSIASVSDWETYLSNNPIQVVYELATPITINLTPHTINLLKGVNNISTDGDKITLTYRDGSVATLGDLTSAVDNLDSKIEDSKILTDTATGDKYILVVTNGVLSVEQISN